MFSLDARNAKVDAFERVYGGRVVSPSDRDYLNERTGWNLAANQRPEAVVTPEDTAQVRAAIDAARQSGLRIAAQGTGHNAGALEPLVDTVLLKTSALTDISIDPVSKTARVGAGVVWEDVVEQAAAHGLTALHGSSPNVGVVGYLLGGGVSWYSRTYGLATNHVRSFEVVLADGSLVKADRHQHRELFWALRGGGGSFGVVTAVEVELFPITTVYAGMMIWSQEHAPQVLRAWRDLTATLPDAISSTVRLMNFPPLPELPEVLRGRRVVVVDGVVLSGEAAESVATDLVGPLRALTPEVDTFACMPATDVLHVHMDPVDPIPVVSDSTILSDLPDAAINELLAVAGPDAPPALLTVELRHLGGAIARRDDDGGVTSALEGKFLVFAGTVAATPEQAAEGTEAACVTVASLAKFGADRPYLNFMEHPMATRTAFAESAWRQVVGIKSALDPADMFVGAHAIPTLFKDGRPST